MVAIIVSVLRTSVSSNLLGRLVNMCFGIAVGERACEVEYIDGGRSVFASEEHGAA